MSKKLIPAVGYIRMSDRSQDASPGQQRAEIKKLAKRKGYRIVRWYVDLAVSGDDTEKRSDFQRMIADAEEKRDFDAILCWDLSRFGRFDSIEAGHWVYPIRKAGVRLVTVAEGSVDWNDFAGRVVYSIQAEGKHQYLQDLSRNVTRARLSAMQNGTASPSPVYGYDRLLCDPSGKLMRRVPYGEKFTKPKEWAAKLAPAKDKQATGTVEWIFDTYANTDCGIHSLVTELNRRGVPSPRRAPAWNWPGVQYILCNPIYVGLRAHGQYVNGKYFQVGESKDVVRGNGKRQQKKREKPLFVYDGDHEPLIDRDTFERVQQKMRDRKQRRIRPRHDGYLLTGLLICGHCGGRLYGGPGGGQKIKGKGSAPRYYVCGTGTKQGNGACRTYRVRQELIDAYILDVVHQALLTPEAVEQIREAVYRQAKARVKPTMDKKALRARVRDMDRKITKAAENVLLAESADMPELAQVLGQWRKQRMALQAELDAAAGQAKGNPGELAEKAMTELGRLRQHFDSSDPMKVRAVVKAVVAKITLWWEAAGKRRPLSRGLIEFNSESGDVPTTAR